MIRPAVVVGEVAGLVDSHAHTTYSCDGKASMVAMIERAVQLGLKELTLTDHLDLDPGDGCADYLRLDDYLTELQACQERYADRITLRIGLEIGDVHRYGATIQSRLAGRPIDFLIGSVHYIDGLFVGGPRYLNSRAAREAIETYFGQVLLACATGGFDVHGHLDVFKRHGTAIHGPFVAAEWAEPIRAALRLLIERGSGLEINTSGLRTSAAEPCPGLDILRWYRELGGEILTLGSDSHRVEHLGFGIEVGAELARTAGFRHICTFHQRQPVWHAL